MWRGTVPPRAVVADERALERSLVRFLLDEAGYVVVAEARTARDAARAVGEHVPDVVVLHENAAVDRGVSVVADLRQASPSTKVIVITLTDTAVPTDLLREADAVIQEGAGIQELGFALARTRGGTRTPRQFVKAPFQRRVSTEARVRQHQRWFERLQGAVAASILIIAVVIAGPESDLPPSRDRGDAVGVHLSTAYRSLEELAERAATASPSEVASLARTLITQRAFALASGADVSALDQQIATTLGPLLPSMSPEAGATLLAILEGLLPGEETPQPPPADSVEPTPSPEPPPRPNPNETSTPTPEAPPPSETPPPSPEPTPSETPSPEPTASETPTPEPTASETPSPEPTGSETPSASVGPQPSMSDVVPTTDAAPISPGVFLVPPGIGLLVAVFGAARRRRNH
jgi:outer membrane biosynthesis protein TonB/ActR/RegA family two-component response regulator